jgi:hypothetical protein
MALNALNDKFQGIAARGVSNPVDGAYFTCVGTTTFCTRNVLTPVGVV